MDTQSYYTRQMLLQYGKQLVAARRLARYDQLLGRGRKTPEEASARRAAMVERVSREIMENLIFSGSENPIVREVRKQLDREMGGRYVFRYPPGEQDFQIYRIVEGAEEPVHGAEKQSVMSRLWEVTTRTVDAGML